jgi:hypothetical protein
METEDIKLDEWSITLTIRTQSEGTSPYKWDFTTLLDLNTGTGEQAWIEDYTLVRSGTEIELNTFSTPVDLVLIRGGKTDA